MVLCRAVAKNPHIVVTDFEADLPTPYTASTLAFLKRAARWSASCGSWAPTTSPRFDRWQRWREIFTMVPVVVVDRPGWRLKALASKAARAFAASACRRRTPRRWRTGRRPAWTFLTGPAVARVLDRPAQQGQGAKRQLVAKKTHSRSDLPWKKASRPNGSRPRGRAERTSADGSRSGSRVLKGVGASVYLLDWRISAVGGARVERTGPVVRIGPRARPPQRV